MEYMNQHLPSFPLPILCSSVSPPSILQRIAVCILQSRLWVLLCFIKSPLLAPLNSECLYLLYPSKYLLFSWKHDITCKTNKNKENKKLTEYYHKLKERDHERKEKVIFSCLRWHFFPLLFECLLVPANSVACLV